MQYGIVDHHFVIEDEELGISFRENSPFVGVFKKEFRKDKSLLLEACYLEKAGQKPLLHGPVRYYFQDGKLSSECWYVYGEKTGRALAYNTQGVLVKNESFTSGVLHGKQTFYYDNGLLQAELFYDRGMLHGQISLYYPSGQKKRQIDFVKGKRHGQDVGWDESGKMCLCLAYANGVCLKDQSFDLVEQKFQFPL